MDARPYNAAMANKLAGRGYENVSNYDHTQLEFLNIDNIHAVRGALKKLHSLLSECKGSSKGTQGKKFLSSHGRSASGIFLGQEKAGKPKKYSKSELLSFAGEYDSTFLGRLESTRWLRLVGLILSAANKIVHLLDVEGASVLVHCSDGENKISCSQSGRKMSNSTLHELCTFNYRFALFLFSLFVLTYCFTH